MNEINNSSANTKQLWNFLLDLFLFAMENEPEGLRVQAEVFEVIEANETIEDLFMILNQLDPIRAMIIYLNQNVVNEQKLIEIYHQMKGQLINKEINEEISEVAYGLVVGLLRLLTMSTMEIEGILKDNHFQVD
jgi:hypothetical protein